jgi:serine protease Do
MLVAMPVAASDDPARVGSEQRAWLGVFLEDAIDGGVELVAIIPGGPAERAGLRRRDIVIKAGKIRVGSVDDFTKVLRGAFAGETVSLQVLRSGQRVHHVVELASWPERMSSPPESVARPPSLRPPRPPIPARGANACGVYGLYLAEVTPDLRSYFGAPSGAGVLITGVAPERPAAVAGFRVGDVLVRLGNEPVRQVVDVERVLQGWDDHEVPLEAFLVRGGKKAQLELRSASDLVAAAALVAQPTNTPVAEDRARELIGSAIQAEIARLRERIRELEGQFDAVREPR